MNSHPLNEWITPEIQDRNERILKRPPVLDIQQLHKSFEHKGKQIEVLRNVDFTAYKREFICVVGPSGCGKSTLARLIAGLETIDDGSILMDGKKVTSPGPDRGMVFQSYSLFPWMTVKENVMFGLIESGMSKTTAEPEALQWIDLVGLEKFTESYPHQLSGGMKQRVAIIRALANQPKVLLMDEPFAALDPKNRLKMQQYLLEIWQNIDITIFFITHDLDEAIYLADRILVLDAHPGRVKEVVNVPLPRPRANDTFLSPAFMGTKAYLESLVHHEEEEPEDMEDKLKMVRMVSVNSDVPDIF
ncbi:MULTISPECIES: ABC transporter ATP-binding protein [Thiomicrorhabdus]|uniref:ABC transporter ATP-binding protein n=1 Tax=Thiomicrorhabdus heinhorstiae TaxID=2748010 RepID=A0ABS0BXL6_9GAMM|nr:MULTISPECIES: ABC transporter ATP-binding protein [Thiomicrorhabdus]MBF6058541.1 ABC transporter ATP-binding protein [Thiomicrorhabdus heinhorstiae]